MLDHLRAAGDEHAALAGRDRLRRVHRVDACVPVCTRLAAMPGRTWACAQSSIRKIPCSLAVRGDPLGVERDVAADVDQERRSRLVPLGGALEVRERHAEVLAVAVDELDLGARPDRGQRRRHERVRRAEHRLALDAGEVERRERAAGPARERDRGQSVPRLPGRLEARGHVGLGPAVGVEHLVDQRVQASAIAVVEADREPCVVREVWLEAEDETVVMVGAAPLRANTGVLRRPTACIRVEMPILPVCVRADKPVRQAGRYRFSVVLAREDRSSAATVRRCELAAL